MVLDGFPIFKFLHHGSACSAQQQGDDVTDHLKDLLYRLVHTLFHVLNGELLRLFRWLKPPLFYPTKLQKIIEKTKHFLDYFIMKKLSVSLFSSLGNRSENRPHDLLLVIPQSPLSGHPGCHTYRHAPALYLR